MLNSEEFYYLKIQKKNTCYSIFDARSLTFYDEKIMNAFSYEMLLITISRLCCFLHEDQTRDGKKEGAEASLKCTNKVQKNFNGLSHLTFYVVVNRAKK